MKEKFTPNEIIVLIILALTAFFKALITLFVDSSQKFRKTIYDKYFDSITIISDIVFLFYFVVALYFVFIKKITNKIFLFIFILLIFKFLVYYILGIELYIYSKNPKIDRKKLEKIDKIRHFVGMITGIFLLIISFYVIRKIFV
jgi:hypothetical protein